MQKKRYNMGSSELLGTIILLGVAVLFFSLLFLQITTEQKPAEQTFVNIVGTTEENCIILEHRGGELLSLDSEISITVESNTENIKVGDYLDEESKEDKLWNLGEKMIYPIQIDAFNLSNKPKANIVALDGMSNSLIMMGSINVDVVCDLGLNIVIDNPNPEIGTNVVFTLTLTNYGNINVTCIQVIFLLPEQLIYVDSSTSSGIYNEETGIWMVTDILCPNDSGQLIVEATVKEYGTGTSTQMVILMDGSENTNKDDWEFTMNGLANAIENQSTFPQTGGVELTIIQFGDEKPSCSEVEIGPVVITEENHEEVAKEIIKIEQMQGKTPTACGFYLAAETLINSDFFSEDKKQIALLISRGNPTECCPEPAEDDKVKDIYESETCSELTGPKESSFNSRDFLVKRLKMTEVQDRVNVVGVGASSPQHEEWLVQSAWPKDGYWAPPFKSDLNLGWACRVDDWEGFIDTIDDIFADAFSEITVTVEIGSTDFTDPKISNNFCVLLIY